MSDDVCLQPGVEDGPICLSVLKQSDNYVSRFDFADRRSAAKQTDVGSGPFSSNNCGLGTVL